MGVPLMIFSVAFAGAGSMAAQWLPPLAPSRVGALSFVTVCALLAVAGALVGLHVYEIVRALDELSGNVGVPVNKPNVLAEGLVELLRDAGTVLGLAIAVYLLAPADDHRDSRS
jgi:hypothetical protein